MRLKRNTDTERLDWLQSTRSQVSWVRESRVDVWIVSSEDEDTLAKDQYSIRSAIDSAMRAASAIEEIVLQTPRVE
jgi:poly(3-hydroxyalkanoate) synthetase